MAERLPITSREVLIRYGRLAPNARDRVLDQFYLLVPDCASLQQYVLTQMLTFGLSFVACGTAIWAFYVGISQFFNVAMVNLSGFSASIVLSFEFLVFAYIMRRRVKYRRRYQEKFLQPTEIGVGPECINVHHRIIHGGCVLKSIKWNEVSSVELLEPTGAVDDRGNVIGSILQIRDHNDQKIELQLDYIQTIEERQILRDFMLRYIEHVDVRPVLTNLLRIGKRDDIPFTKLWCQALQDNRPRLRTAPLVQDALLQEGRFTIVECIGGGGQGTVYAAQMRDLDGIHNIVLKEYILPDFEHTSEHKAACEQFEKEIRLLGLVDHDGVIKLIDAFVEDHRAYLVLNHVNGHSLRDQIDKQGAISQTEVIDLAMQMCEILQFLHSMKPSIMHLDFSPENLLLSLDKRIVLIDFNISVEENALRTRTVMGKQRYMAPEQYRGTPSTRSDVYSLGATLFYLLTGREPEPITVARVSKFIDGIDPNLDVLIARCTALEETERYQSADEVLHELKKLRKIVETQQNFKGTQSQINEVVDEVNETTGEVKETVSDSVSRTGV